MEAILFLVVFFGLLAAGLPIFLVLGLISFILFWMDDQLLVVVPEIIVNHLNSITLMAIPFFVMAATFMQKGGIAQALIDCAYAWVGRMRGGLAMVCVVATTIFAAISGSSVATALAMGTVLVPAMLARKYERHFALGVVGASGTLGILIPPSLAMIVYGIIAEQSVPRLFLAGVVPGLIQAGLFGVWVLYYAHRKGYPKEERLPPAEFLQRNLRALPALAVPVIVLGGIYSGIVTVTEAAALSAFVAVIVGLFFYRGFTIRELIPLMGESIKTAATIIVIIATALVFGHWITESGITQRLVDYVVSLDLQAWQFLLFINLVMLLLGMFLEVIAVILITLPLVLPILEALSIDPIHYAIIVTVNMELALLTPPIGLNLYVLSSISKAPITTVIRGVTPFIVLMLALLVLVTYVPAVSTWLPNLVMGR